MLREGSRIHLFKGNDVMFFQVAQEIILSPEIACYFAELPRNKTLNLWTPGLHILTIYPIITDEGVGHGNDLPLI